MRIILWYDYFKTRIQYISGQIHASVISYYKKKKNTKKIHKKYSILGSKQSYKNNEILDIFIINDRILLVSKILTQ